MVPPELPYTKLPPDERTMQWRRFRDSLRDRLGFKWVEDMYSRHRGHERCPVAQAQADRVSQSGPPARAARAASRP